jgi:MYXO-CTERM domain-containing protein
MRARSLIASLPILLAASTAFATVTEPNGSQVPLDSANGETQLYTLFSQIGDPVDWQADASSTPNQFSPLCGFTATFVLHESSCLMDFAWYNETGQPPQPSDLHVIIPAGSALGQTFTGTDIKNDPNYKGGLVGFAILANNGFCSQNHFANPAWNPEYSAGQPWIAAVIYASKNTPNAYYIGFEDGPMVGMSFNNDGDFNDDVFFLTGLTCSGGGQQCDTMLPGICGPGLTQCTSGGVVCNGLSQAAPTETCNGLDDDCNGQTDEGDICPAGFVCDKGTCVQSCAGGEFTCPPSLVCNDAGYCVDPACKDVDCPIAGQVCVGGFCKGPCDDVTCPFPLDCRVGKCVDPCATVTCEQGQVCDAGACVPRCDCFPCAAGKACDATSGLCLDPSCIGVPCGPGTHCVGGQCVDACTGAVCPTGEECQMGQCVPKPSGSGSGGSTGSFGVGVGGGEAGGASGSGGMASATGAGGSGGANNDSGSTGGCGCRTEDRGADAGLALIGAAIAIAGMRRRRR